MSEDLFADDVNVVVANAHRRSTAAAAIAPDAARTAHPGPAETDGDGDGGDDDDDDDDKLLRGLEEEVTVRRARVRARLDEERLLAAHGLPQVRREAAQSIRFKGKGGEVKVRSRRR